MVPVSDHLSRQCSCFYWNKQESLRQEIELKSEKRPALAILGITAILASHLGGDVICSLDRCGQDRGFLPAISTDSLLCSRRLVFESLYVGIREHPQRMETLSE